MLTTSIDGVTVAKSIQLKDKFENLGARWYPVHSLKPLDILNLSAYP
jgi:hypothetical protein